MEITKTQEGDGILLQIEGFIDTANTAAFEAEVDEAVSQTKNLTCDLAKVEYISSSGLRVLLKAQKKLNFSAGKLVIKNLAKSVREVFELTGFLDILTVE